MPSSTPTPSPILSLCIAAQAALPLTKAQKTFNSLIKKIGVQRTALADWMAGMETFHQTYNHDLVPLLDQEAALRRAFAVQLDRVYDQKGVTKAKKRTLSMLIAGISEAILVREPDPEAKVLYYKHTQSDWDEEQAQWQAAMKAQLEASFGVELEDEMDLSSPEGILAEIQRTLAAQDEARQQAKQARQKTTPKKQTAAQAKQAEKEAAQAAAQKEMSLSIREVYRKLASALHPDREPDPAEKTRKTTLMQAVNEAYDKSDLLKLLELQLAIEQIDQDHLANVNPVRLTHYIAILREQLAELECEINHMKAPFAEQFSALHLSLLTPKKVLRYLADDIEGCKQTVAQLQHELHQISTPELVPAWLQGLRAGRR